MEVALYVYEAGPAAEAAAAVGAALGVELELHDSSYYGGDYYRAEPEEGQVIIVANFMEDDGEPFVQTQPDGAVCVQVDGFQEVQHRLLHVAGVRRVDAA